MKAEKPISSEVGYFFKQLEKRSNKLKLVHAHELEAHRTVPFEDVEKFFRQIMTQNIFIHTVGVNGKHESTILAKAMFSMNGVVRIYYSTSFDETQAGFIRIRPNCEEQLIIVERLHGCRAQPELLYASHDQCHVIRYMVRWLLRRIDWDKTKLANLDLYKRFLVQQQEVLEAQIIEQAEKQAQLEAQRILNQPVLKKVTKIPSR